MFLRLENSDNCEEIFYSCFEGLKSMGKNVVACDCFVISEDNGGDFCDNYEVGTFNGFPAVRRVSSGEVITFES